jgi:hypothetical protein
MAPQYHVSRAFSVGDLLATEGWYIVNDNLEPLAHYDSWEQAYFAVGILNDEESENHA